MRAAAARAQETMNHACEAAAPYSSWSVDAVLARSDGDTKFLIFGNIASELLDPTVEVTAQLPADAVIAPEAVIVPAPVQEISGSNIVLARVYCNEEGLEDDHIGVNDVKVGEEVLVVNLILLDITREEFQESEDVQMTPPDEANAILEQVIPTPGVNSKHTATVAAYSPSAATPQPASADVLLTPARLAKSALEAITPSTALKDGEGVEPALNPMPRGI